MSRLRRLELELGIWCFPGAWNLGFGALGTARRESRPTSPINYQPSTINSPAPVIPQMARFGAFQRFAAAEDRLEHELEMLARRIQSQFARGGEDGVAMQDGDAFALGAREFFEAFAELKFFAGEEFNVEAAEFPECGGVAKDERAGHPAQRAAGDVPQGGDGVAAGVAGFEADGAAAGEALAGGDLRGDVIEERGAGVRVGVDEDEPVAGGGAGAAIARAADLVDGLKDDLGAGGPGDFRGAVGGVIVADDEFGGPSAPGESGQRGLHLDEGFAKEAFFVEGGNDDRD